MIFGLLYILSIESEYSLIFRLTLNSMTDSSKHIDVSFVHHYQCHRESCKWNLRYFMPLVCQNVVSLTNINWLITILYTTNHINVVQIMAYSMPISPLVHVSFSIEQIGSRFQHQAFLGCLWVSRVSTSEVDLVWTYLHNLWPYSHILIIILYINMHKESITYVFCHFHLHI